MVVSWWMVVVADGVYSKSLVGGRSDVPMRSSCRRNFAKSRLFATLMTSTDDFEDSRGHSKYYTCAKLLKFSVIATSLSRRSKMPRVYHVVSCIRRAGTTSTGH
jgi:hypothetical protein